MAWEFIDVNGCNSYKVNPSVFNSITFNDINVNLYLGSTAGGLVSEGTKWTSDTSGAGQGVLAYENVLQLSVGSDTIYLDRSYGYNTPYSGVYNAAWRIRQDGYSDNANQFAAENQIEMGLCLMVDHTQHYGCIAAVFHDVSEQDSWPFRVVQFRMNTTRAQQFYNILVGNPPVVWKAWTILQGNNGQYRQRLTALKDGSIGNISSGNYGTQNDFIFIAPNVDMVPYARNMNFNSPVKVAWSGINWMTMELQSEQGLLTNQVKAVFKLFAKNSSETIPIYQETRYFFIGSTNHFYLSFVHDDDMQVAAFLPVYYTVGSTGTPFSWGNATPSDAEMLLIWQWLQASGSQDPEDIPDHGVPYDNGTTDNGGGGGNPIPQDDIHTPNVPALGAMSSGMFTIYCPTDTQLGQISAWLWSDNFIDNIKKYFNNASDNIISFYVLPLEPDNLPTKTFKVGNLENDAITNVKYLTTRFVEVDMGSVQIEKRWETYLDFAPYTKFSVYLPGIGVQALDTDDLMCPATMDGSLPSDLGSTISLSYVIDLMTGVLVAYVKINGQIRYQFPGKMGYQIPLTGENYTRMAQGFVTAVSGIAATVATAGTAAPFAASAGAAGIVNAMKPEVYRGGNLTGDASMLSLKTPLLIRTSPNKPKLDNQEDFTGFPSYKIGKLSEFSGYTEVVEAHVEDISCTDEERERILAALRGGVII